MITKADPLPAPMRAPTIPKCNTPIQVIVTIALIAKLLTDTTVKSSARFSARSNANTGTVKFCSRITMATVRINSLGEVWLVKRKFSADAVKNKKIINSIELRKSKKYMVASTLRRSLLEV